ncbi:MAG: DMT family transporter [Bacteroidetes bacterium]|nr:DMT family transporter [Bacteroidota bacterium]MBU1422145.1 DMT family transporter [Bacteroidota bacterium]
MVIKVGLESIPPFYGAAFRFFVAVSILFIINIVRGSKIPSDKDSRKVYYMAGLLSFSIPFALVYWGQQYIPSSLSSILFALYPLIVGIFSHFMLRSEPLNIFKISGIILGFSGVVMIFARDIHWDTENTTLGMAAIIISSILQALSLVLIKKYGKDMDPFHLNFGGMLIGLLLLLLFAVTFENVSDIKLDSIGIGSVLYLGILGSVVTFSIYFWMLKRIEAVYLSLLAFVTPILAIILGAIILNEKLDVQIFYGGAFVLTGILLANGKDLLKSIFKPQKEN